MKKALNVLIGLFLFTSIYAQKEKLELNLLKGGIYKQKITSIMTINQTVNGQLINMDITINGSTTYKVIEIQNTVFEMEVRYESLTMKMGLPNGVMEFNSEKNDETDIFSTILNSMINKPFLVKMTNKGKVNEVKNLELIFSNMFEKFPQLSDAQKEQIKNQLLQAYGEKAFKGNIEMFSAIFPNSPVSKGDKWTIKTQLESGMAGKMNAIYILKEINDSHYLISGEAKIETADKEAYIESNGMPLKYNLNGTMNSEIKIDKKSGWIINAVIKQSIKGTAYVKDNPKVPGGMEIPMTLTNQMIITE